MPILRSSPLIRRAPQRRLFRFISITNNRIFSSTGGRPTRHVLKFHLRATRCRCHFKTVAGLIVIRRWIMGQFSLSRATNNSLSLAVNRGFLTWRFRTWSSFRSIKISRPRLPGMSSQIKDLKNVSMTSATFPIGSIYANKCRSGRLAGKIKSW